MKSRAGSPSERWEQAFIARLGDGWRAVCRGPDRGVDFVSTDGRHAIAAKHSAHGARDLQTSLTRLALYLDEHADAHRATFVVFLPRMSAARARHEWEMASAVLRKDLSRRLALVALAHNGDVLIPDDPEARNVAAHVPRTIDLVPSSSPARSTLRWSSKSYEIWKVLLGAWLRREGPLPLHEIQRRSGASYPSVSILLERLQSLGELERTSNRSAVFTGFPRRTLNEVQALGDGLRETRRFIDRSGRRPEAGALIHRISTKAGGTALGGVAAARYYMPAFNLNGNPRADVTVAAGDDLSWVRLVDPALAIAEGSEIPAALVVHRLRRPVPDFMRAPRGMVFADPAEVLLDLYELRLIEQADELVDAIRGRAP